MKKISIRSLRFPSLALGLVVLVLALVQARDAQGQTDFSACPQHFANGKPPVMPPSKETYRALCFESFAVLYSADRKTPVWVAEALNRQTIEAAQNNERTDRFYEEARLRSAERAQLEDYKGSGFDRGHMAPAGNQATPSAMAQSFSLANIIPQAPKNNQGIWSKIEQDTRKYVLRASGNVYVITGSVYDPQNCPIQERLESKPPRRYDLKTCTIGDGVAVPSHIYKLVYDPQTGRSWAHWVENRDSGKISKPISLPDLSNRIGINISVLTQ